MSDETEMNPELESFAANLRNTGAPEAKVDRDQLMYDAGWAAAMAQRQPATMMAAAARKNGMPTMVLSFVSGIAVAAAVLLSVVPFANDGTLDDSANIAVVESTSVAPARVAAFPTTDVDDEDAEPTDLLDWIENMPPGHSVAAGFSSRPVSPNIGVTNVSLTRPAKQSRREPTTHLLIQELVPNNRRRKVIPDWTAWLNTGT